MTLDRTGHPKGKEKSQEWVKDKESKRWLSRGFTFFFKTAYFICCFDEKLERNVFVSTRNSREAFLFWLEALPTPLRIMSNLKALHENKYAIDACEDNITALRDFEFLSPEVQRVQKFLFKCNGSSIQRGSGSVVRCTKPVIVEG